MLEPHEFFVGTLDDTRPGTLVLPRHQYEMPFLVGTIKGEPVAMVLAGDHAWHTMPCANSINWRGMLIPDIAVVVDHTSLVDPERGDAPLGSVVRMADKLAIRALEERGGFRGQGVLIELANDLPAGDSSYRAAFLHWQVVLGRGDQRRVLFEVDLRKQG